MVPWQLFLPEEEPEVAAAVTAFGGGTGRLRDVVASGLLPPGTALYGGGNREIQATITNDGRRLSELKPEYRRIRNTDA